MMKGQKILARISLLMEGKSLQSFCDEAGLGKKNYETIKKWFQRKKAPDDVLTGALVNISRRFRVDLNWLITGQSVADRLNSQIGKKIKLLRGKKGWSKEDLCEKLKMSPNALGYYEKGAWPIPPDLLSDFAKSLNIPARELLREGDVPAAKFPELKVFQSSSAKNAPVIRNEDYISIPLTGSTIAAGQPIIQTDNIEEYVLLHVRVAKKRPNMVASRVNGDSMEPMLHSGDIVIIDRDDKKVLKHKIYAIFFENGLTAKYVQKEKNQLILQPINPEFQVQIVDLKENPDPIVGRIVGAWKDF